MHQLAYRPSVQHVIDLTSGYAKNGVGNPIPISMIEDKPWDHLMIGSNTVLASADVALQLRCNLIGFINECDRFSMDRAYLQL